MKTPAFICFLLTGAFLCCNNIQAQSNIERCIVYEINKIRAASCLDSFYYSPEISASCREKARKIYELGNVRIKETEEQGIEELSERFHRYLPERYKRKIACITARELVTSGSVRFYDYPDDVAAKEIVESFRNSLLNNINYSTYLNHELLQRKIGISVIPDKNSMDIVVVALFTGTKDGVPTITPAWKPLERKIKTVKTAAGSNPKLIAYIKDNLDSFNKNTTPVEVADAEKKLYQLAIEGYALKINRTTFDKTLPQNSTFCSSSGNYFMNQISKPMCYYSIKKKDSHWELTMLSGVKE